MIDNILQTLGITKLYSGYHLIKRAVNLAVEDETRLLSFRDSIYVEMAKEEGSNWKNIERNMRTAIKHAWELNPSYIAKLAGYELTKQPSVSEFVAYLAGAVEKSKQ
jgi:two-component system response regulator (stage 0 sporulation protein A)